MDHLPSVADPYEPISVPYLGGKHYDGLDFEGYPTRRFGDHFCLGDLLDGSLQGRTELEIAQFLQTWLYFGMLYEAYRLSEDHYVNQRDFIRVDAANGEEYITTASLPSMFDVWHRSFRSCSQTNQTRYYERFRACMVRSSGVYRKLMEQSDDSRAPKFLSHEVLLSIQILGAAIDIGVTEVCGSHADYSWRIVPRSSWLMERMIQQGWCPCTVEQISRPCATFLYYASLLGPPTIDKDHGHCRAEARACIAANVKDEAKYVSKHVEDGCLCDFVVIETGLNSKVALSIAKGEIPVIRLERSNEDGDVKVDVVSFSEENPIPYVAISHVWSDGLGDPDGNRLPRCQINRLAELIAAAPRHPETMETNQAALLAFHNEKPKTSDCFFWMDTLCIPKEELLRHQAITKMSDVYSSASKVLVLTAELMRHPSVNRSYSEIFTRISCSTWLRRLWTLQESILNPNLLFQFSDRAIYTNYHSSLYLQQVKDNSENPWNLVRWECNRYHLIPINDISHLSYARRVNHVWGNLNNRTTSRGGDEPLCIAILLGLDLQKLQEEPDACSVKKFWTLHQEKGVPAQVLFIPGLKLNEEGLHWAPSNLMDLAVVGGDTGAHADVTPEGLCLKWPGFLLEKPTQPVNFVLTVDIDGETFYIRQNLRARSPSWDGLDLHKRDRLAVIVLFAMRGDSLAADGLEAGLGVLVDVHSHDKRLTVIYLRIVSVLKKGGYSDNHPNIPWEQSETEEKAIEPVHGRFLNREQQWCVG